MDKNEYFRVTMLNVDFNMNDDQFMMKIVDAFYELIS